MTTEERELFDALIREAGKLATAADQASVVLSEEHQSLTAPFVESVRAILAKCPAPSTEEWDGKLRDTDINEETYATGRETRPSRELLGVKVVHLPTGIGRQSESKVTQEENREVARRALTQAVQKEYDRRRKQEERMR
jgi:hypothetical protein